MSNTIDERIVQMRFDNENFEKNIKTSVNSIESLNKSINSISCEKGLSQLSSSIGNFDLSGLSSSVDNISNKFSLMGIAGVTALSNIVNKAVDAGTSLVKSLTVDQITTGFNEYELKMGSVQTIMNGANVDLQTTMNTLEELNKYADRTIYSFSDMTTNIAKFVNAGVDLQTATEAIKGISNEAALSGASAVEASRAMYNIAQAIGTGSMKLIDWKSIENANMATMGFKEELVKVGKELKTINGETSKVDASELTATNFRESISGVKGETWITNEVMLETLKRYSDETTELGKKAYAAAQDVKTFSMLMDTLKEAAQSGWAETMENIFGDFEEAKKMWTEVNNEIGGILDASAKERNKLLNEWKEGGGREALMNSVANIWFTLKDVISSVKEEFHNIFPKVTSKQLIDISKRIEAFTKKIKDLVTESENLQKIRNIFSGIFSGIDILRKGILSLFNTVKPFFSKLLSGSGKLGTNLLDSLSNFGLFITNLNKGVTTGNVFSKTLDTINNGFNILKDSIKKLLGNLKNLSSVKDSILGFFDSLKSNIGNFKISLPSGGNLNIFSSIKEQFNGLTSKLNSSEIIGNIDDIMSRLTNTFKTGFENIKKVLSSITIPDWMKSFSDSLSKLLTSMLNVLTSFFNTLSAIFDGLSTLIRKSPLISLMTLFRGIISACAIFTTSKEIHQVPKTINGLTDALKSIFAKNGAGNIIGNLANGVKNLTMITDSLAKLSENFNKKIKAETASTMAKAAKEFAIAIGILVASLAVISAIDSDKLAGSLTALIIVMGFVAILLKSFVKLTDASNGVKSSAKMITGLIPLMGALILFSAAIGVLAKAVTKIGSAGIEGAIVGAIGVVVLIFALASAAKKLENINSAGMIKAGVGLILFAESIKVLAKAVNIIGTMNIGDIAAGLSAIVILLYMMASMSKLMDTINVEDTSGLLVLAVSVGILASALSTLGAVPIEQLIAGFTAVTAMLGELLVGMYILNGMGISNEVAIGLLALAVSLKILASVFIKFSEMDMDQFGAGMLGFVAICVMLMAIVKVLPDTLMNTGAGLLMMAIAIDVLSLSIKSLGSMSISELGVGLLGMAAGLTALVIAVKFMEGSIAGAAAMLIVSVGLIALAAALKMMSEIDIAHMGVALLGLVVGLAALAVAMIVMQGAIGGAAAMLVASIALLAMAGALTVLGNIPIKNLGIALLGLVAVIVIFAGLAALLSPVIPLMLALAGVLALIGVSVVIASVGMLLISEALFNITEIAPTASIDIMLLGKALLFVYPILGVSSIMMVYFSGALLAVSISLALFSVSLGLSTAAIVIFSVGLIALSAAMIILSFATLSCAASIAALNGELQPAADGTKKFAADFVDIGRNLLSSFIDGLKDGVKASIDAITEIGRKLLNKFKSVFGLGDSDSSSSFEELGEDTMNSFSKGIEKGSEKAEKESEKAGEKTKKGFLEGLGELKDGKLDLGSELSFGDLSKEDLVSELGLEDGIKADSLIDTESFGDIEGMDFSNITDLSSDAKSSSVSMDDLASTDLSGLTTETVSMDEALSGMSDIDLSNVKELENVDTSKTNKKLTETDSKLKNISKSSKDINNTKVTPKVDTSNIDKAANDVIKGLYGNGQKRWEALAKAGYNWAEVQNKVNEKLGSSVRHSVEEGEKALKKYKKQVEDVDKSVDKLTKKDTKVKTDIEPKVDTSSIKDAEKEFSNLKDKGYECSNQEYKPRVDSSEIKEATERIKDLTDRGFSSSFSDEFSSEVSTNKLTAYLKSVKDDTTKANDQINDLNSTELKIKTNDSELNNTVESVEKVKKSTKEVSETKVEVKSDISGVDNAVDKTKEVKAAVEKVNGTRAEVVLDTTKANEAATIFIENLSKMTASTKEEVLNTKNAFSTFFQEINAMFYNQTSNVASKCKSMFSSAINQTVTYLASAEIIGKFRNVGIQISNGLVSGIKSKQSDVKKAAGDVAKSAATSARKALDIHSPSRIFEEIGALSDDGLIKGLIKNQNGVEKTAAEVGLSASESLARQLQNLDSLDALNSSPTIRPVLDLSDVETKAGQINTMLGNSMMTKISSDINFNKQQNINDSKMNQNMELIYQKLNNLETALSKQQPTPVNVDVQLEGDAKKLFNVMRDQSKHYTRTTGKYAF